MIRVLLPLCLRAVVAAYMCGWRIPRSQFGQMRFAWLTSVLVHGAVCAAVLVHRLLSRSTLSLVFLYLWMVLGPLFHHQRHEQQAWLFPQHQLLPTTTTTTTISKHTRCCNLNVVILPILAASTVAVQQLCLRLDLQSILQYFDIGLACTMGFYALVLYTQLRYVTVATPTPLVRRAPVLLVGVAAILVIHTWASIRDAASTSSLRRRVATDEDGINTIFHLTIALMAVDALLIVRGTGSGGTGGPPQPPSPIETQRVLQLAQNHTNFQRICREYDSLTGEHHAQNPWHTRPFPLVAPSAIWSNPVMYASMSLLHHPDVWNVSISAAELALWAEVSSHHRATTTTNEMEANGDTSFFVYLNEANIAGHYRKAGEETCGPLAPLAGELEGAAGPLELEGAAGPLLDVYMLDLPMDMDVAMCVCWLRRLLYRVGHMTPDNATDAEHELGWTHIKTCLDRMGDAIVTLAFYVKQCVRFHTRLQLVSMGPTEGTAVFAYDSVVDEERDLARRTSLCRCLLIGTHPSMAMAATLAPLHPSSPPSHFPIHSADNCFTTEQRAQFAHLPCFTHRASWNAIKLTHDVLIAQHADLYARFVWTGFFSTLSIPISAAVDMWLRSGPTTHKEEKNKSSSLMSTSKHIMTVLRRALGQGQSPSMLLVPSAVTLAYRWGGPIGIPQYDASAALIRSEPWFPFAWTMHMRQMTGCKQYMHRLFGSRPVMYRDVGGVDWISLWHKCRPLSLEILWDRTAIEDVAKLPLHLFLRKATRGARSHWTVLTVVQCMRRAVADRYAKESAWKTLLVQIRWAVHVHNMGTLNLRNAWAEASEPATEHELVAWLEGAEGEGASAPSNSPVDTRCIPLQHHEFEIISTFY